MFYNIDGIFYYGHPCELCGKPIPVKHGWGDKCDCKSNELQKISSCVQNMNYTEKDMESAIDIAINAGYLLSNGQIKINDSREFCRWVVEMAGEFNRSFDSDTSDYLEEIDYFAYEKLLAKYAPVEV